MSALVRDLFRHKFCNIIGMIHVGGLPGTPAHRCLDQILNHVEREANVYKKMGVDGVIIENMHDTPYCRENDLGPEITASMTAVGIIVRSVLPESIPIGVQVLAAANRSAIAVAQAAKLQFIRAEGFVFSHVADEGWIDGCAGPLLRYRRQIGADHIAILTDIKKKHSAHAVTADVSIAETAEAAQFFRSDGIILTGTATGQPASPADLNEVAQAVPDLPAFIGSGVNPENLAQFSSAAGLIVGTYFKKNGRWQNELDEQRIERMMEASLKCRS